MKYLFVVILLIPILSISQVKKDPKTESLSYSQYKSKVITQLTTLRTKYAVANDSIKDELVNEASSLFTSSLTQGIFHYWIGTTWDFNGYTNTPKKGTIACGYFVSTTLKHIGFNLNRYRLAQKGALDGERYLCGSENITVLRNKSAIELVQYVKRNLNKGLCMIGLANHVGYLYYDGKQVYFIHSNYGAAYSVVIEPFANSDVSSSAIYAIANLSTNKSLMQKWLTNDFIPIP